MLSGSVRILNLDNSLISQKRFIERFLPKIIDLKAIAPSLRLWLNRKQAAQIRAILEPQSKNDITFLGSGDFHHISSLLLEQFREPINLIVFDHHPDWDTLPPKFGCGSWISRALGLKNIEKIILFGVSSNDISALSIQSANLAALKDNRLEIYPYQHKPTKVFLRNVPDNISLEIKKGLFYKKIFWQGIKDKDDSFFLKIIERIKTKKAYISIDKDCLNAKESLTNWEEGGLALKELLSILKLLKDNLDIAGIDIAGDYSEIEIKGMFKKICSKLDHPRDYSARAKLIDLITETNQNTNIKIIELLKS